jgi:hypothetical protein
VWFLLRYTYKLFTEQFDATKPVIQSRLGGRAGGWMDGEDQWLQGLLGKVEIIEKFTKLGCVLAHIRTGIGATIGSFGSIRWPPRNRSSMSLT